jgi:hypothetical protein
MRRIIWIGSILLNIGCYSNKENLENNFGKNSFVLEFEDTLISDFQRVKFADRYEENLLFYDPGSFEIIILNMKNYDLLKFKKFGAGPEDYFFLMNNLGFDNTGNILVSSIKDVKKYSMNGDFMNSYSFDRQGTQAPIFNPFEYDKYIMGVNLPQGDVTKEEFYKEDHKIIFSYDTVQNSFKSSLSYKKESSKEEFFLYNGFIFGSEFDDNLHLMDKNENNMTLFNLESKTSSRLKFNTDYFHPFSLPFNRNYTEKELDIIRYQNSTVQNFFIDEKSIVLIYTKPYSEDEIFEFVKKNDNAFISEFPTLKYVLHISNKEGDKIFQDILLPESYGIPIYSNSEFVLFLKEDIQNFSLTRYNLKIAK